jgi:hypothetical protein
MRGTRILRYIGNRIEPERELFGNEQEIHSRIVYPVIDIKALKESVDLLTGGYGLSGLGGVYVKPHTNDLMYSYLTSMSTWNVGVDFGYDFLKPKPKPVEVDFEVNLVEPLVGWKSWNYSNEIGLHSQFDCVWTPAQAIEAYCTCKCTKIPAEHHSCGFYAVDDVEDIQSDGAEYEITGQVYGWGRYIRGENGWRSQFAYPKSFHLRANQAQHIHGLERYGVPIYIDQPLQIYFPEENGYEHRQDDTNGNIGTIEDSGTTESQNDSADYETGESDG